MVRRYMGMFAMALSIIGLMYFVVTPERSSLSIKDLPGDQAGAHHAGSGTPPTTHGTTADTYKGHHGDILKDPNAYTPKESSNSAHQETHQEAHPETHQAHSDNKGDQGSQGGTNNHPVDVPKDVLKGKPIMGKMTNQTARRELGNAGWRLLHTILAQYPEEPTQEDRQTLEAFFQVFSRVYPCRECAEHFQQLLADHPPQLSSRKAAVMWGCDAHNKVNKRLEKPLFDCNYIGEKYDCGCGDEDEDTKDSKKGKDGKEATKEASVPPVKGG